MCVVKYSVNYINRLFLIDMDKIKIWVKLKIMLDLASTNFKILYSAEAILFILLPKFCIPNFINTYVYIYK